ncbi:uncharacterized protein DDB_G0288133-like [Schistocerca gregaria]|uniref:uncharacterized protein DDB_G0288133-like n=1 Tax=Schistocerca gregaria TaxID=7010 RepID=UPI00211DD405|nr:uncharacterized protein DDB_G0288133-like [Schistocerca gregaria]
MNKSTNMFSVLNEVSDTKPTSAAPHSPKRHVSPQAKQTDFSASSKKKQNTSNTTASKNDSLPVVSKGVGPSDYNIPSVVRNDGPIHRSVNKGHQVSRTQLGTPREREFDRHPGSGIPLNKLKKGGAGSHNWGSIRNDIDQQLTVAEEPIEVLYQHEQNTPAASQPDPPKESCPEHPNAISYTEYMIQQQEKQKEADALLSPPKSPRKVVADWYKQPTPAALKKSPNSNKKKQKPASGRRFVPLDDILPKSKPFNPARPRGKVRRNTNYQEERSRPAAQDQPYQGIIDTMDEKAFPVLGTTQC